MRAFATNGKTEARVHLARNIYRDLDSYFTSGDIRKRINYFFELRHRHERPLTRPAVLSGSNKDQTREGGGNRA